jgi:hypothetical protein
LQHASRVHLCQRRVVIRSLRCGVLGGGAWLTVDRRGHLLLGLWKLGRWRRRRFLLVRHRCNAT